MGRRGQMQMGTATWEHHRVPWWEQRWGSAGCDVGKPRALELLQGLEQHSSYLALLGGRFPRALQRG